MENPYWPLFGMRIQTSELEIRLPDDNDLIALASLALKGVHDPLTMPFLVPWTDESSPALERGMMKWGWRHRSTWEPNNWTFNGAVVMGGEIVGVQSLSAIDFATRRTVKTGSWLGLKYQGQGIGKAMRDAILHFAFVELEAKWALSGGFIDNESSLSVSRALGYVETSRSMVLRRDIPTELVELKLDRSTWELGSHAEVKVTGFSKCREFFFEDEGDH